MSNPRKARGTRWETMIVGFLRSLGLKAFKPRPEGFEDVGDVHSWPFVIQAKDWKSWEAAIREGLDGAVRQAERWDRATLREGEPRSVPVAVVKRARRPVGEAYAVLPLRELARLTLRDEDV